MNAELTASFLGAFCLLNLCPDGAVQRPHAPVSDRNELRWTAASSDALCPLKPRRGRKREKEGRAYDQATSSAHPPLTARHTWSQSTSCGAAIEPKHSQQHVFQYKEALRGGLGAVTVGRKAPPCIPMIAEAPLCVPGGRVEGMGGAYPKIDLRHGPVVCSISYDDVQ
jgi:hypothetical protein